MNRRPVDLIVSSWGAVSCFGQEAQLSAALHRAGRGALLPVPMIDSFGERVRMSLVPGLSLELRGTDRLIALAAAALVDCLRFASQATPREASARVALAVSERFGAPGNSAAVKHNADRLIEGVQTALAQLGFSARVELFPQGRAAGGPALAAAIDWLARGDCETALVGGVHSYFDWDELQPYSEADRVARDQQPDGFIPGEAAAFLAMMRGGQSRRAKGVTATAKSSVGMEPHPRRTDRGECMARGFIAALDPLVQPLCDASLRCRYWLTDAANDPYRTREIQLLIAHFGSVLGEEAVWETPSRSFGDVGAATLPLYGVLTLEAWREGYAVDDRALLLAGSEGAERAAWCMERLT